MYGSGRDAWMGMPYTHEVPRAYCRMKDLGRTGCTFRLLCAACAVTQGESKERCSNERPPSGAFAGSLMYYDQCVAWFQVEVGLAMNMSRRVVLRLGSTGLFSESSHNEFKMSVDILDDPPHKRSSNSLHDSRPCAPSQSLTGELLSLLMAMLWLKVG